MSKNILNEGYQKNSFLLSKGIGSKVFHKKKLIDLSFCAGSLLLGHNHKIYSKTILDLLKNKVSNFAAPNIYAEEYAKLLKQDFTNCSKIIFGSWRQSSVVYLDNLSVIGIILGI